MKMNEFEIWLQGVETMQSQEWVPNEHQWRVIRAKLKEVVEAAKVAETVEESVTMNRFSALEHRVTALERSTADRQHSAIPRQWPEQPRYVMEGGGQLPPSTLEKQFIPPQSNLPQNGQVLFSENGAFA